MSSHLKRHGTVAAVLSAGRSGSGPAPAQTIAEALAALTGGTPDWWQVKSGNVFRVADGSSPATSEGHQLALIIRPGDNPASPAFNRILGVNGQEPTLHIDGSGIWFASGDGDAFGGGFRYSTLFSEIDFAGDYTMWAVIYIRDTSGPSGIESVPVFKNNADSTMFGVLSGSDTFAGNTGLSGYNGLLNATNLIRARRSGATNYFASSSVAEKTNGTEGSNINLAEAFRETNDPLYLGAGSGVSLIIAAGRNYTPSERAAVEAAIVAEYGCPAIG